jgi:TPR repeat protein
VAFSFLRWRSTRPDKRALEVQPNPSEPEGAEAQFRRGLIFASGQGAAQDFAQAAKCYTLAAEQNHSSAQMNLALLYQQGQGVARDEAKFLMWLTKSANLGNAAAQYRLGVQQHLLCRNGSRGAEAEGRIEALKWTRLSAAQGYRDAEGACQFVALGNPAYVTPLIMQGGTGQAVAGRALARAVSRAPGRLGLGCGVKS